MKTVLMVIICMVPPAHGYSGWQEAWRIMKWEDNDTCGYMRRIFQHSGKLASVTVSCNEPKP